MPLENASTQLGLALHDGLIVVGMDPSSYRNCGWAIVQYTSSGVTLLDKFTQVFDGGESDISRYRVLYDMLEKIIKERKPSVLCLERSMGGGLAFVRNNLSETVGVAKLCCHDNGVKVYETSPGHLKKIIAGHGSAKKKWIKSNIVATFNLGKSGAEHECDAAACALSLIVDLGWNGYVVKVPYVSAP
jgi:Holliday junction resolvasome RuvABC endonuclease subunit